MWRQRSAPSCARIAPELRQIAPELRQNCRIARRTSAFSLKSVKPPTWPSRAIMSGSEKSVPMINQRGFRADPLAEPRRVHQLLVLVPLERGEDVGGARGDQRRPREVEFLDQAARRRSPGSARATSPWTCRTGRCRSRRRRPRRLDLAWQAPADIAKPRSSGRPLRRSRPGHLDEVVLRDRRQRARVGRHPHVQRVRRRPPSALADAIGSPSCRPRLERQLVRDVAVVAAQARREVREQLQHHVEAAAEGLNFRGWGRDGVDGRWPSWRWRATADAI